ncbi:plasma protease C1 inhibitor [Nelusetta ayraudi]|uniref:plasma protease C1 inhibitor n=1 Tax=Nelusetta ayraudi TaxID=303726 RepID=UPI003F706284
MRLLATLCLSLQLIFKLSSCTNLQVTPGSSMDLPCLSIQTEFTAAAITWQFNGKNISAGVPGFARVKDGGLHLSIPLVTAAHEGEYTCLVKGDTTEILRIYSVRVDASIVYTVKGYEGHVIYLPCQLPGSTPVQANTVWSKDTDSGTQIQLNFAYDLTGEPHAELLYPGDHDQTVIMRNLVMEDAGIYRCHSAEGEQLSTVQVLIEVRPITETFSCESFASAWEPCQDENSRTAGPILQESIAEFSMNAFSHLRESQPTGNLLFSPISISALLTHLLLGARGNTQRALESAVSVPHEFHCVHLQMKKLRERVAGSMQIASQIYYNPEMNISDFFSEQSMNFYGAEPTRLLETGEANSNMINSWVANKTNNHIKELVDFLSPSTQLILLNAVSFRGQWKVNFEPKPKKGMFTKLDGSMVNVPILFHENYMTVVAFMPHLKAQVAKFNLTGDSSLYILLPRASTVDALQEVETRMTYSDLQKMITQMRTITPSSIEVTLPLIKLNHQPNMHVLIKKLGLSSLFEGANLCGLYSGDRLVLDDVRHKAFLALTEQGVEAGAASSISFSRSYSAFSALQPFVLVLWSDEANVPLFVGRVTDP